VIHEMLDKGNNPNVITYTAPALIAGFCKKGKLQEAFQLLDVMVEIVHQPSDITYNTLVDGFCKVGNLEKASELLQEMLEKGCRPDLIRYSTLIDGFCKNQRKDKD